MSARRVSSRLDSLSTRLWQEAIRLEKLHDQMDDCLAECEAIEPPRDIEYETAVAAITEAAMRGEIAFDESLRRRVATLAGLSASVLPAIAARLTLSEGAERLVASLKSFGYKTAIISGGFSYFGKDLQRRIGIDHVCANELEIVNGVLTGRVLGSIINAQRKAAAFSPDAMVDAYIGLYRQVGKTEK